MPPDEGSGPVDLNRLDAIIGPLIHQAGEVALQEFRSSSVPEDKGGSSGYDPVTASDRMTEMFLRRELSVLFPDIQIVGEEGGTTGPAGRATWTIDPIDGTRAYVSGMPLWGVLLGLIVDGRPEAGWCRQPYLDETFAAIARTGWLDHAGERRPLSTRPTTELAAATMYSTHPSMFEAPWEREDLAALAADVRLQRFGGDCYSYCMLASGHLDLVVEASLQSYDIVPSSPSSKPPAGWSADRMGRYRSTAVSSSPRPPRAARPGPAAGRGQPARDCRRARGHDARPPSRARRRYRTAGESANSGQRRTSENARRYPAWRSRLASSLAVEDSPNRSRSTEGHMPTVNDSDTPPPGRQPVASDRRDEGERLLGVSNGSQHGFEPLDWPRGCPRPCFRSSEGKRPSPAVPRYPVRPSPANLAHSA